MPIILKICQYVARQVQSNQGIQIPIALAFTLTLGFAIYFELWLPRQNDRYTSDIYDVILYFIGFMFFVWIERVEKSDSKDYKETE